MKKQRKWVSESEILKAIDACHRRIVRLTKQAQEQLDLEELNRGCDISECRKAKDLADELLSKIERLKNTRLKKLQRLLAEFRTQPLGAANGVAGLCEEQVVLSSKE